MKKLLVSLLTICTVTVFCACGGSGEENNAQTPDTQVQVEDTQAVVPDTQVAESEVVEDGKVEYCVTLVDEEGNPFAGVMLQMCKDLCVPAVTDEAGVARFNLEEDYYDVKVTALPEGYTYSGDEDVFHFEDGSLELTITLKPEA